MLQIEKTLSPKWEDIDQYVPNELYLSDKYIGKNVTWRGHSLIDSSTLFIQIFLSQG